MGTGGTDVVVAAGYVPGAIGRVAEMHGAYYHREWGFGLFFEAKVATELAAFLSRGGGDGFWSASRDGRIEGSIAIDGLDAATAGAHLRWFIVSDALRGRGAGGRLLDTALDHCRARGYRRVRLWTFAGLDAARHLYESRGFRLAEERRGAQWGTEVTEQRFELALGR
jgi:GNAT superfamily N-acetyltransferase